MFTSTLRPIARQALRSQARYSSTRASTTASSSLLRNAVLGGSALAAVSYALAQRQEVRMEGLSKSVPRESVLDAHSLKEPLHRRGGEEKKDLNEKKGSETPSVVEKKSAEAEESQKGPEGAFNEETGEINWDCPCLGGMADGPCGEDFKAAFSCFVYSEAEPKGMDCVEKFKGMQDCFRQHPEIYGEEIDDDEPESGAASDDQSTSTPASSDKGVPPTPKRNPPENSPVLGVNPDETPSKGYTKIRTSGNLV